MEPRPSVADDSSMASISTLPEKVKVVSRPAIKRPGWGQLVFKTLQPFGNRQERRVGRFMVPLCGAPICQPGLTSSVTWTRKGLFGREGPAVIAPRRCGAVTTDCA